MRITGNSTVFFEYSKELKGKFLFCFVLFYFIFFRKRIPTFIPHPTPALWLAQIVFSAPGIQLSESRGLTKQSLGKRIKNICIHQTIQSIWPPVSAPGVLCSNELTFCLLSPSSLYKYPEHQLLTEMCRAHIDGPGHRRPLSYCLLPRKEQIVLLALKVLLCALQDTAKLSVSSTLSFFCHKIRNLCDN